MTASAGASAAQSATERPPAGSVLLVKGVGKAFSSGPPFRRRRIDVLRDASLQVDAGELVGLVGENAPARAR